MKKHQPTDVLIWLALACVTLAIALPIYRIVIVSFSNGTAVLQGRVGMLPVGFDLSSYRAILKNGQLLNAFYRTVLYTVCGTAVNLLMTTLCAYPLSRKVFKGRSFFSVLIVFTMYFSGGMIPSYLLVTTQLKLTNTIWALVLPGAISTYNMIVMRTFFANIPGELYESATVDGASDIRMLTAIVLPLSKAVLSTILLFYAVEHWNSFMPSLLYLNKRNLYPLQMILRNLVIEGDLLGISSVNAEMGMTTTDTSLKYAAIVVATTPILLIYPFIQKYFMKGVMLGSLKG